MSVHLSTIHSHPIFFYWPSVLSMALDFQGRYFSFHCLCVSLVFSFGLYLMFVAKQLMNQWREKKVLLFLCIFFLPFCAQTVFEKKSTKTARIKDYQVKSVLRFAHCSKSLRRKSNGCLWLKHFKNTNLRFDNRSRDCVYLCQNNHTGKNQLLDYGWHK